MKRLRSDLGKWKSRGNRNAKDRPENAWSDRLTGLRLTRAPFDECARKIMALVAKKYLPNEGLIVEVGAGAGQLRSWLPEGVRARVVHTDSDDPALGKLREDFPEAETRRSGVENLPFGAGETAVVAGLCVLDVVADLPRAMSEMHRVLRPGGRLIHLLDMAPTHHVELAELASQEKFALPNLFGEPLEDTWPFDLLVTDRAPMKTLLEALRKTKHPLPDVFGRYFAAAMAEPFDAERASREFDAIARTPKTRELLKTMLHTAYAVGWQLHLEPPRGTLVSSGQHLSGRLERAAKSVGFDIVVNDVMTAWHHRPAENPEFRCRSLALGQGRLAVDPKERLVCKDAPLPSPDHELVELGMYVFVAEKA